MKFDIKFLKMGYEASLMGSNSQLNVSNADAKPSLSFNKISGVALVVDDEKSVLRACASMVKHCGLSVITACDGLDALSKFGEHGNEIDIVVMDLTMPNLDGIAAMEKLRNVRPDIKVIISSGFDEKTLNARFTEQRPSGFIRKPFTMKELETELRRVMLL